MGTVLMTGDVKTIARTALILVVALVVQLGLFDYLSVFSVHAQLLLAVGIASAIAWGPERGAIVCFVAGLFTDLVLSGRFGVSAMAFGLTGYGVGLISDGVARRGMLIDAGLMTLGGAVGVLSYAVIAALFGATTLAEEHLWRIVLLVALWNLVLSPGVLPICRWAGHQTDLRPIH